MIASKIFKETYEVEIKKSLIDLLKLHDLILNFSCGIYKNFCAV
jgi:hypothetical protein